MARKFPRFLYSNPSNTKNEGPFVVHLLEPRAVFKVDIKKTDTKINIIAHLLESFDNADKSAIDKLVVHLNTWLFHQVKAGEIIP